MGVLIKIGDRPEWRASRLVVAEDSTPADPGDMTGGTGQITFSIPNTPANRRIRHQKVRIEDTARGSVEGQISTYGGDRATINVTADARTIALNVERTIPPFAGTLGDWTTMVFAMCGVTSGFLIDPAVADIPLVLPGTFGNVYERLKQVGSATQTEISLVSSNIVLRPMRTIIAQTYRNVSLDWTIDDGDLAQTVEGYYYSQEWRENALVYPAGGWNEDVAVYSVDAGEVLEVDLELSASLISVQQPVAVSEVGVGYSASSVYCVSGNDGLIIPPQQWYDNGGRVEVAIDENTRTLKLTITGMNEPEYEPYRLHMPTGPSEGYSSLRIVGTGVLFEPTLVTLSAHPDPVRAPEELGATVENEAIRTRSQAVNRMLRTAMRYAGPAKKVGVTTVGINRRGEQNAYVYADIGDFNDDHRGMTIGDWNAANAGKGARAWNEAWKAKTADLFANQAFGNIAGARFEHEGTMYRIRGNSAEAQHRYEAEADTVIGDHRRKWTERTIADWNGFHAGRTIGDLKVAPIEAPEMTETTVYPDMWYPDDVYPA